MYLDTFINNVSRYVTVSRYIWNVSAPGLVAMGGRFNEPLVEFLAGELTAHKYDSLY